MEDPHVPRLLMLASKHGFPFDPKHASYFLGRETVVPDREPAMALWRERIFAMLSRNALGATRYFNLPPERVVELGAQVEL
jgi:KUP system potassium uptake protein